MILLITPSARGPECATGLKETTGEETHWAENLQQAFARLREQSYSVVVLDQFLLENGLSGLCESRGERHASIGA
jgi:DNA-binding response OmpR family regulator